MFMLQKARLRQFRDMNFPFLFGGTILPVLLMLSPLALAAKDCVERKPEARMAKSDPACRQAPLVVLM